MRAATHTSTSFFRFELGARDALCIDLRIKTSNPGALFQDPILRLQLTPRWLNSSADGFRISAFSQIPAPSISKVILNASHLPMYWYARERIVALCTVSLQRQIHFT